MYNEGVSKDELVENQTFTVRLMSKYLNEKVVIFLNNKQLNGELIDQNIALPEENGIIMNLLYKSARNPETILVRNEIMAVKLIHAEREKMFILR